MAANILFVHAHPDDEAIWTGGLIARLTRTGHQVTVVTCTLGEEGETIGTRYQQLVADHADLLGGFRLRELEDSLAVLGAQGRFLGGLGCWRDSGMAGAPANAHPRAFMQSGQEAIAQLVALCQELKPDLLVTYDPTGGYGHPDHIRAHEITHAAAADVDPELPILWCVTDTDAVMRGLNAIVLPPQFHPGEVITQEGPHSIELPLDGCVLATKIAAMKCHPTQVWVADGSTSMVNPTPAFGGTRDLRAAVGVWALSNLVGQPLMPVEHYDVGVGSLKAIQEVLGV